MVFLSDIMQTWSLASQSSNDSLLSAVPAVLALLLKTISNILDFSQYGLRLGRTLLLKKQQELMARGLTANKTKDFVISPVLRLLRELTIFDGGILSKQVFRARDNTFKGLSRNLCIRYTGVGREDYKKPSVRTNAVRFLLSSIKFIPQEAKRELINQRDVIHGLTRDIKEDPSFIIHDILETLQNHVLLDETMPREAKVKVVNTLFLGRIATLYKYDQLVEDTNPPKKSIDQMAHDFLVLACTSIDSGVLNRQTGYYPKGINPEEFHEIDESESLINLGLDSVEWMDRFTEKVPVRNGILSEFVATLHPWSNKMETDLLISILKTAPELVADYFFAKKDFSFEPKLTATWIAYSSFVFSALQLPIPEYFGHHERYARLPPPPSIVLENILPQALSQKVLTNCLNQTYSNLITFFAVRILCISFIKLQRALKMYREAAKTTHSRIWTEAAERLTDSFCSRCPAMKIVIPVYRRMKISDLMQREAITKLLVLYFEVTPRIALDAKFGVSAALTEILQEVEKTTLNPDDTILRTMELENVFAFAHLSPGMRWFSKIEGLPYSPFTNMLKLASEVPSGIPLHKLRSILNAVAKENQLLQTQTSISALDSLVLTLKSIVGTQNVTAIYTFLDECISRCASKPIKYIFALEEISDGVRDGTQPIVSLLLLAILEQWPFLVKSAGEAALVATAQFLSGFLAASIRIMEDKKVVDTIIRRLVTDCKLYPAVGRIINASREFIDSIAIPEPEIHPSVLETAIDDNSAGDAERAKILANATEGPSIKTEDHSALMKWTSKDIEEVIDDGYAASLILLLSSEHLHVRKEAAINIVKVAAKLKESTLEEKDQIWLLLSEVAETARQVIDQEPMATIISLFASLAVAVLGDPVHILYSKINKFLSQSPTWPTDKIPLMHKILDDAPSLDDAHAEEVSWLLILMSSGLRTRKDMAIYHRRRVFERLLSIYNSSYLGHGLQDKILRIFFQATKIEGGSTTLITRFSTMTWLEAQIALTGGTSLRVLMKEILKSCERKRVKKWSKSRNGVLLGL